MALGHPWDSAGEASRVRAPEPAWTSIVWVGVFAGDRALAGLFQDAENRKMNKTNASARLVPMRKKYAFGADPVPLRLTTIMIS